MPVLNMEVPINTEAYYRGETIARREGVSLYDKFAQWLNEYIEDADDAAALNDAMEKDDGTRYTSNAADCPRTSTIPAIRTKARSGAIGTAPRTARRSC